MLVPEKWILWPILKGQKFSFSMGQKTLLLAQVQITPKNLFAYAQANSNIEI